MNMPLFMGALLCFLSVIFGAYFSHGLTALDPSAIKSLLAALDYQRWHGFVMVVLGLLLYTRIAIDIKQMIKRVSLVFLLAIVLFSGSIYIAIFANIPELTKITPVGGFAFMFGWLLLLYIPCKYKIN